MRIKLILEMFVFTFFFNSLLLFLPYTAFEVLLLDGEYDATRYWDTAYTLKSTARRTCDLCYVAVCNHIRRNAYQFYGRPDSTLG